MKLLLTGLPGTGKTTLIRKIIPLTKDPFWVLCAEIRNRAGQRVGFGVETSTGLEGVLAHKEAIASGAQIGDYRVDLAAIDRLLTKPIMNAMRARWFLVIDEIGRMQMLSPAFGEAMRALFDSTADFVATIRYGDEWTREFTDRRDVVTLVLTAQNRDEAEPAIAAMVAAQRNFTLFSDTRQQAVIRMAKRYGQLGDFTQLKKLYKNAVKYLIEGRVSSIGDHEFRITGDHGEHRVARRGDGWSCDCDLFHGRGQFAGKPGECSHIQSAKLLLEA